MSEKRPSHESDDSHLIWDDLESEVLHRTALFSLRTVHRRSPDGRSAPFISVKAPDWVTVVAETGGKDGKPGFLIVRQYRHGTGRVGLEFPAGVIDPGETPREAAARELREETGHEAGSLEQIGAVSPNPAFMTNTTYTFLASDLRKVSDTLDLDRNELLDVHELGYGEVASGMGDDPFDSAITVQSWHFYLKARGMIR